MVLSGHQTGVSELSFCARADYIFSGTVGGTVHMWDIAKRTDTVKLLGHQARVTCLSYDMAGSTTLLTGSEDTRVKYWDVRSGKAINTFKEHSSKVNSVQFSPDSRWAASGSDDGALKIWELSSGKVLFNVAFP